MGRVEYQTVQLTAGLDGRDGPADGRTVSTAHAWVWVAVQDGELIVYDTDRDPSEAMATLGRVKRRADWAEYRQDEEHPDLYRYLGSLE